MQSRQKASIDYIGHYVRQFILICINVLFTYGFIRMKSTLRKERNYSKSSYILAVCRTLVTFVYSDRMSAHEVWFRPAVDVFCEMIGLKS